MNKYDEVRSQNEWAKNNISPGERMVCLICGKMVDQHWMVVELEDDVGNECAPCYFGRAGVGK